MNSKASREPGLANIEHLNIVVYTTTSLLEALRQCDLARYPALRSLSIEIVYDTVDSSRVVDVWRSILAVLRSIPATTALEHLTLTSPVPLAALCSGWSRSALVAVLQQPLYSIDHCLVRIVDRAPLEHVTVVPPQGETFFSSNWARVRSFFRALYDYDMLRY
ncbi:hypothetical protein PsYK624_087590 [Phanerochaete sordida]|uniref:Uncharacterized protein n=1 Tax=Phanerochaete sordida TaxID=48140 RepID=A0A9P3LFG5_9APHY|nr:hypothetical protein PsYK624_087590 [Phanerochaete sordida]